MEEPKTADTQGNHMDEGSGVPVVTEAGTSRTAEQKEAPIEKVKGKAKLESPDRELSMDEIHALIDSDLSSHMLCGMFVKDRKSLFPARTRLSNIDLEDDNPQPTLKLSEAETNLAEALSKLQTAQTQFNTSEHANQELEVSSTQVEEENNRLTRDLALAKEDTKYAEELNAE
ncbi:hypothetical protein L7F22_021421 [Adiantum nelumboides]|nr:hypothetical protein [Adiantum nelumboides]